MQGQTGQAYAGHGVNDKSAAWGNNNQQRPGATTYAQGGGQETARQHPQYQQQPPQQQRVPQRQGGSCAVRETVIDRQVRQSPNTVLQHTVTVTEVMQQPNSGYSSQAAGSAMAPGKPSGSGDTAADAVKEKNKQTRAPKHVGEWYSCSLDESAQVPQHL